MFEDGSSEKFSTVHFKCCAHNYDQLWSKIQKIQRYNATRYSFTTYNTFFSYKYHKRI